MFINLLANILITMKPTMEAMEAREEMEGKKVQGLNTNIMRPRLPRLAAQRFQSQLIPHQRRPNLLLQLPRLRMVMEVQI